MTARFPWHTPKKTLTEKQRKFLEEFPKDLNATQAAIRAGYSSHTANEQSCRLLKMLKTHIQREVFAPVSAAVSTAAPHASKTATNQTVTDYQRFLTRLHHLAFFDVRKLFDTHGNPIDIADLPEDVAPAIAGFEILEEFEGRGEERKSIGFTKKFKLVDPLAAILGLGKICGFYSDKSDRAQSPLEQVATETLLAMKEEIERRQLVRSSADVIR